MQETIFAKTATSWGKGYFAAVGRRLKSNKVNRKNEKFISMQDESSNRKDGIFQLHLSIS